MGLREWVRLGRETLESVERDEVAGLYTREWESARRKLVAGRGEAIQSETNAVRRFFMTANAVLLGLTRRLAPPRRLMLLLAFVCVIVSAAGSCNYQLESRKHQLHVSVEAGGFFLVAAFVLVLLLLALELVDKIEFRNELELARQLQADLVPAAPPSVPGFEIGAANRIANLVGGDLYDFETLDGSRLAVLFGDASGHGMTAGLIMAVAHAGFRTQLDVDWRPAAVVASLNRILCRTGNARSFFSAVYLVVGPGGSVEAAVAGHPPIWIAGPDGFVRRQIGRGAYPLGIRRTVSYPVLEDRLEPDESLILCSDGVTEARTEGGEEFGEERLFRQLRVCSGKTPAETAASILSAVRAHCGARAPEDDVSVVVLRRTEAAAAPPK